MLLWQTFWMRRNSSYGNKLLLYFSLCGNSFIPSSFPRIPPVLLAEGEGEVCVHGTSTGDMLRWQPWCASVLSRIWLFATPRTVACQATLSMEFSRQETGVGCHFLLQGIFLTQGLNPHLPSALAGGFFTMEPQGKPLGASSAASWRWGWSQGPRKNPR